MYANISNFEPKTLFSHKDDNHKFNIIYSTLLSMNNLTKIFPNCLLQIIAFCATGTIIKCDGNCTNEILFLKSNQFLNFYKIYQAPHKSIVKLCIDCISNDDACICQFCHNKYPSCLIDIVELQGWRKGCVDCKIVWPKLSNLIKNIIVNNDDWTSLTNGKVKQMLKNEFGKRTVRPFKELIKKRIQQVVVNEMDVGEKKAPEKPPSEKEYYIQLRKIDAQICNPDMVETEIEEMLTIEFQQLSKRDVQVIQNEIEKMRRKFEQNLQKKTSVNSTTIASTSAKLGWQRIPKFKDGDR